MNHETREVSPISTKSKFTQNSTANPFGHTNHNIINVFKYGLGTIKPHLFSSMGVNGNPAHHFVSGKGVFQMQ